MPRYLPLFSVDLSHNFFADNICRGVTIEPSPQTQNLMARLRLLRRSTASGITIYFASADANSPIIPINAMLRHVFYFYPDAREEFVCHTDLSSSGMPYKKDSFVHFEYSASTNLARTLLNYCRPKSFRYLLPVTGAARKRLSVLDDSGSAVYIGKDASGTPYPNPVNLAADSRGHYEIEIDLRDSPPGKYIFREVGASWKEEVYVDDDAFASGAMGAVTIDFPASSVGATPNFKALFNVKAVTWKYLVLIASVGKYDPAKLSLSVSSGYSFNKLLSSPVKGLQAAVFKSTMKMPYKEIADTGINLLSNGSALKKDLPNASVRDRVNLANEAEIFVYI